MSDIVSRVREALAAVYDGAGRLEAEALLDQLEDRGLRVTAGAARVVTAQPLWDGGPLV